MQEGEKEKELRPILRGLNCSSLDIEASAVMTRDGLAIASVLGEGVDPDRLSAMCAAMLGLANTTASELNRGNLEKVLIEGDLGFVLVVAAGDNAVLTVVARPTVNLGMVFLEAKRTADKVRGML
ncbi:MAG: roadblock/LC7 domain-containing protein [Gammaproteobacteria bacterium]|nr:MAG: roadblock/LC7 domain-containing protein [Gammaproteobacteria bacterium]